jgi:hypothetical protein
MSPMQNPNDLYSYYPASLYQPFGTFDEHNQWGSPDTSNGILQSGPLQFHPQMYTPTGLDISRNTFDYPLPHGYPHYHPAFTPSTFPGAPSTGTSAFDMSWNPHNLSIQQQQQQQMPVIGNNNNLTSNKKSSVYDEYPSTNGDVGDMLSQHINSVNLGNNDLNVLTSKEQQQQYQTNSSNLSLSRPSKISSSSGPKSYASVVSSDMINSTNNKLTPSISNIPMRSNNERILNLSNDSLNTQNRTEYNSRYQQQQSYNNGDFPNWTNNNDRSSNTKRSSSSRIINNNQEKSDHQYNPKDFNLNPKGARFFVIKSVNNLNYKKEKEIRFFLLFSIPKMMYIVQ